MRSRVLARLDAADREKDGARSETQTLPELGFGSVGIAGNSGAVHAVAADIRFAAEALR